MNYIQHTRAAHELLLARPDSRPQHFTLYWALFFAWNAARFPGSLPLDRDELMAAARIGNRSTYTDTLRALESFGLLAYQPSHRAQGSHVRMTELGGRVDAQVGQPKPRGCTTSGATEEAEVDAQVSQPVAPQVRQPSPEVDAQVDQRSLLSKTLIKTLQLNVGGTEKKRGQVFSGEGLSEAQILDDPASPNGEQPNPGAAPKTSRIKANQVASKKKGVRERAVAAAAQAQAAAGPAARAGGRRPQRPEVPFAESDLASFDAFAAAFAGTDYGQYADLRFYHEKIRNWRQKGEAPRRRDWKATATQFFLNDAHDNRLKLAPGITHAGGADAGPQDAGIPATGYRSSRWD